ncbi:hypothetical protein TMEN_2414 [Trichophyton mentagrophytes]|nr:GPI ethanolamine phosphate transferase [Trichophyton interdigitale]KAG5217369.1 GPI ethanolamine phosphate transferase [Trichophyton interdigitale]KAG8205816.1 GPI ethanolamine phosphate transferase [Trichophyton interdigitale]GBF60015.1 hypothetical protein TMEN_2414 [Trichophyton mentagrophytes]
MEAPSSTQQTDAPFRFLDLPFEIRHEIYSYCIPYHTHFEEIRYFRARASFPQPVVKKSNVKNKNALLRVSKQISEECLNILYGKNRFYITLNASKRCLLANRITTENRARIRDVVVIVRHMGPAYGLPPPMPADGLWSSLLPGLRQLKIIAEQPVQSPNSPFDPAFDEKVRSWIKWFGPLMECFAKYLTSYTVVEVDENGKEVTTELVRQHLTHSYRVVRDDIHGDFIFQRGRFAIHA